MINFIKMHALSNDFVIINNDQLKINFNIDLIKKIADRHQGIGCDQILIIESIVDKVATFSYKIFNADGSEVEQCINGARCIIKYINDNQLSRHKEIMLKTTHGTIIGKIIQNQTQNTYQVALTAVKFMPQDLGLNLTYNSDNQYCLEQINFSICQLGNPHLICAIDPKIKDNDALLTKIAKSLQSHGQNSLNINFYYLQQQNIYLRTYERGVGFTHACGSGAAATAIVTINSNLISSPCQVIMPGGNLEIAWDQQIVRITGTANAVFSGIYYNA